MTDNEPTPDDSSIDVQTDSTPRPTDPEPADSEVAGAETTDPDTTGSDVTDSNSDTPEGSDSDTTDSVTLDSVVGSDAPDPSDVTDQATDTEESPRTSQPADTSQQPANTSQQPADTSRDRSAASSHLDFDSMLDDEEPESGGSKGLFDDLLAGEPIFENKEVLRPSYTPHNLPHRTDQINQMATILVSALRGDTPSNILIYGKTGTGKTASAKFVSQELESTSEKYDVPCEVEYINCEVTDTQYRVLAQLANKFIEKNVARIEAEIDALEDLRADLEGETRDEPERGEPETRDETDDDRHVDSAQSADHQSATGHSPAEGFPIDPAAYDSAEAVTDRIESLREDAEELEPVPMTGWPTDRVYSTFFDAVDYNERVVVIMLDEIDKLVEKSGDDTLYNLSRMNSELTNSRISIMGISNDLKFTDFLDPRVKSSLGEEEIVFPPYDATQLRDILQHRADVAFKPEALTSDVIPLCAAFAAQEHGDARRALDLLRTAGELAERSQADLIEENHVRQAQDKIELDRVVEVVRTLPTQSKIVLFSIILLEKNGVHNINTGEVFNIYKRLCEEIDADVLTQRRVTDLISELDMLGIVNAVVVSKGRYGRTKEMGLSVPLEETEAVLLSDSRLGDIENVQPFVQARFDN